MDKRVKKMILTSIFAAMSVLLYLFPKFSLPIFPSFLEINFSMLPIVICAFSCGPLFGGACVLIRCIVNLIIEGSVSVGVGEIMDLILGFAVVLGSGFMYKYLKVKEPKKSILSLLVCIGVWILAGVLLNVFYAVPAYLRLYFNGNKEALVSVLSKTIPGVNSSNYMSKYVIYAVIPFNLMLSSVVCIVTFFVNKAIYILYDDNRKEKKNEVEEIENNTDESETSEELETKEEENA